jgi:DNA-binding HxlR family transcriptional regulator
MQFTALRSLHIESYVMKHTNLTIKCCPIALSLDRVGEGWSIMILRDAFLGLTRFDQFQRSLGIAPNILSRRLRSLVEAGLLEKSRYSEHPPRDAYLLTDRGRDFRPVLWALVAWGNKHFMPEGEAVVPIKATRPAKQCFDPSCATPKPRASHEHHRIGARAGCPCAPEPPQYEKDRHGWRRNAHRRGRGLVRL